MVYVDDASTVTLNLLAGVNIPLNMCLKRISSSLPTTNARHASSHIVNNFIGLSLACLVGFYSPFFFFPSVKVTAWLFLHQTPLSLPKEDLPAGRCTTDLRYSPLQSMHATVDIVKEKAARPINLTTTLRLKTPHSSPERII